MIDLYNGDCLEVIPKINNENNVIITSPPYNMNLRIRNGKYCSRQITKEISTKYNNYSDNLTLDEYFEFNKSIIDKYLEFCPLMFYNIQMVTGNKPALLRLMGHYHDKIKEIIIWDKINSQPAIRDGVMNSQYEFILVFDKYNSMARRFENANFDRGTLSNVWKIKRDKPIKGHKATFPKQLVEKIITNFMDPGQVIIDPMMGTGTTGIVAKKLGYDFIGIELDEEYFNIAKERIKNEGNQINLF